MFNTEYTGYDEDFQESMLSLENYKNYIEIEIDGRHLSTESIFTNTIDGITSSFSNMISKLGFFSGNVSSELTGVTENLTKKEKKFLASLAKASYPEMGPLKVYVPEGLETNYVEYLEALESGAQYASAIESRLDTFHTYLALVLSTHDGKKINKDNTVFYPY